MSAATSPSQPAIEMMRGDTLYFLDQLLQNPVTGQFATARPGTQPPEGFAPYSLAGCSIWFTAKDDSAIPDIQAPFQLDNVHLGGVAIINSPPGLFSVTGAAALTQGFADGVVVLDYDVQFQLPSGHLITPETGTLSVFSDITRAISPFVPGSGPSSAYGPFPGGVAFFQGTGSPNGVIVASPGAVYSNLAGGIGTTLYAKTSGVNTATGWTAFA